MIFIETGRTADKATLGRPKLLPLRRSRCMSKERALLTVSFCFLYLFCCHVVYSKFSVDMVVVIIVFHRMTSFQLL